MRRQLGCSLLTISVVAWIATAWLTHAHNFKQLRVVVNQLDSATLPDLQQREKDMNEILKQCQKHGIYLQVTIEVRTNQNPTKPDGTPIAPGGNVPNNGATIGLHGVGVAGEVKTNGVKVWVANEVRFGTNNAATNNQVVNGVGILNHPTAVVGKQSGVNGDAHTWTHELGHTLGLDDLTNNASTNVMSGSRSVGGTPAGNGLTADQCKQLQKGADKRSPLTGKTKEQTNQPPAKTVSRWLGDSVETGWPGGTPLDIGAALLVVDYFLLDPTNQALYVDTFVDASLDPVPTDARYLVWLDLDNDLATGNAEGFDALIVQQLVSPTEGLATLQFLPGGPVLPLPPVSVDSGKLSGSGETNAWEEAVGSVIQCRVALSELGPLGVMIRARVASANEFLEEVDWVGPEEMVTVPAPEPTLQLNVIETLPGNLVIVQGTMFNPETPYRITFDSTIMAEGMTTPAGEINASFIAPDLVPGDYLVDAIDASCRVQIAVLRMLDNQGLRITTEGGETAISFRAHPGPTYIVEYKEDLGMAGPWMELQRTNTTEPRVTVFDMPPPGHQRFYRWRQE